MRPATLKTSAELATDKPHGTRMKYLGGCHCTACRAANSRYSVERDRQVRCGESNRIVPAGRARLHLQRLSGQGIGRRAVAASSGVSQTILSGIKTGKRKSLREDTLRRILAVNCDCRSDASYVSAKRTWQQIGILVEEGYSHADLAKRLGYTNPSLQFRKDKILARTALKVSKLYNALTGDEWREQR